MNNNDVLRRVRYAFDLNDDKVIACFAHAGVDVSRTPVCAWLKKDDDDDGVHTEAAISKSVLTKVVATKNENSSSPSILSSVHTPTPTFHQVTMGNSSSSAEPTPTTTPAAAPELAPNGKPKPKCPMCVCKELRAERDACMIEHEDGKTVRPSQNCENYFVCHVEMLLGLLLGIFAT